MWGCISLGLKCPSTAVNRTSLTKPMTVNVLPMKYRLDGLTPLLHETEQVIQEFLPLWVVIYLVQLKQAHRIVVETITINTANFIFSSIGPKGCYGTTLDTYARPQ
jgi:hypothetical protein